MSMTEDLWRECAAWMTRFKVLPPDHKANLPESEIKVLALTLRDGVLLCNLLNTIDPNALDRDFNRKPQMAQVSPSFNAYIHLHVHYNIDIYTCVRIAYGMVSHRYAYTTAAYCHLGQPKLIYCY